jgi:hypothetical protein
MCNYEGSLLPRAFENSKSKLMIQPRDFLAAL